MGCLLPDYAQLTATCAQTKTCSFGLYQSSISTEITVGRVKTDYLWDYIIAADAANIYIYCLTSTGDPSPSFSSSKLHCQKTSLPSDSCCPQPDNCFGNRRVASRYEKTTKRLSSWPESGTLDFHTDWLHRNMRNKVLCTKISSTQTSEHFRLTLNSNSDGDSKRIGAFSTKRETYTHDVTNIDVLTEEETRPKHL